VKIDLEKELGLDQPAPRTQVPWLPVLAALGLLNLVLVAAALCLVVRSQAPPAAPQDASGPVISSGSQAFERTEARLASLEHSVHELRVTVGDYNKTVRDLMLKDRISERRSRTRSGQGTNATPASGSYRTTTRAPAMVQDIQPVSLSSEEQQLLDSLADRDTTGGQVSDFIRGITNAPKRDACIKYLLKKADAWLASAVGLSFDDSDFELYADNALYFYNIVSATGTDNGVLAYAEAKRSQLQFERERRDARLAMDEENARLREQLSRLEQHLKDQDDLEQKRNQPSTPVQRVYKP
jgi:hypothetical protein